MAKMIKYFVVIFLFLFKITSCFGQILDSLFYTIATKHHQSTDYSIVRDTIYNNNSKESKRLYTYEFVQKQHKEQVFAFLIIRVDSILSTTRYYASKNQVDNQFTVLEKNEEDYWQDIELLDLNNDNLREICINYENSYPCNYKEIYNFSTDSIAPIILQRPYDNGILTCIDSTKNLYFTIHRSNIRGAWSSELFVIHKDFSKGKVLGTAEWDWGHMCDNCFYIDGVHPINSYTRYFSSQSKSVIYNFHPHVNHWNSQENIEFMKNAYLQMIKEFNIEY